MAEPALVDLVCGPASPLPETYQRYRLVARIGSGGQADVYRGVRICGGVTSAPITVKVFRLDPSRPLADELRSWDKGDAALMDLNNRGVAGHLPPRRRVLRSAAAPDRRRAVDARRGALSDLRLSARRQPAGVRDRTPPARGSGPRLIAPRRAAHPRRDAPGAALPDGSGRLSGAAHGRQAVQPHGADQRRRAADRLHRRALLAARGDHPDRVHARSRVGRRRFSGEVSPSYDVHGFGSVAFFMLTGDAAAGPTRRRWTGTRSSTAAPALRDHLLAPLADRPANRPSRASWPAGSIACVVLVRTAGRAGHGPGLVGSRRRRPIAGPTAAARSVAHGPFSAVPRPMRSTGSSCLSANWSRCGPSGRTGVDSSHCRGCRRF